MTGVFSDYGSIKLTASDGTPGGVYASDGSIRATFVDGTTRTGLFAADGSYNFVVEATTALTPWGMYHPCGALRCVEAGSGFGIVAPNGAIWVDGALFTFAPELTWDNDQSDTSPDFTAVFDFRAAVDDEVTLEFASDVDFTTDVATYTHTLTAPEIAGDTLSITVTDLAEGLWYARIKHKLANGSYSDWSNTEAVTIALVTNLILMEDGVSRYLMEDGASFYLQES